MRIGRAGDSVPTAFVARHSAILVLARGARMALGAILLLAACLKMIRVMPTAHALRMLAGRPDLPAVDFAVVAVAAALVEGAIALRVLLGRRPGRFVALVAVGVSVYLVLVAWRCGRGIAPTVCPCFGAFEFGLPTCMTELGRAAAVLSLAGLAALDSWYGRPVQMADSGGTRYGV
jgi:hypothetical protein